MSLSLTFRYRATNELQSRTASRLKIDGKGNLLLYRDGQLPERLRVKDLRDLSITWNTAHAAAGNVATASVVGGFTALMD